MPSRDTPPLALTTKNTGQVALRWEVSVGNALRGVPIVATNYSIIVCCTGHVSFDQTVRQVIKYLRKAKDTLECCTGPQTFELAM